MRSGASGVARLDASFAASAMRARECRWYSALSMIAPSVNVLRRTRRKPSTIRGAAPEVVIGQSTAPRAGAHPYRAGELARSYHSNRVYQRFNSNRSRSKGLRPTATDDGKLPSHDRVIGSIKDRVRCTLII